MTQIQDPDELILELARSVCKRGLAVPAIFFLEAYKPLSGIAYQFGNALSPAIMLFGFKRYSDYLTLIEDSVRVERLIQAIEQESSDLSKLREESNGD